MKLIGRYAVCSSFGKINPNKLEHCFEVINLLVILMICTDFDCEFHNRQRFQCMADEDPDKSRIQRQTTYSGEN